MSKYATGDTSASTSAPSPSVNAVSPWSQVAARPSAGDAVRRPRQYRYAAVAVPTIGTGSKLQSSSGDHSMLVVYVTNSMRAYTAKLTTVMYDHCSATARAWAAVIGDVPRMWPMTRLIVHSPTRINSARSTPYQTVETSMYVPFWRFHPN